MLFEQQDQHSSQWAAINSIAAKVGCTPETLRKWVKQAEIDQGKRDGLTSADRDRLKELERENRELEDKIYELQATPDLVNTNDWTSTGAYVTGNGTNRFLFDPDTFSTNKNYRVYETLEVVP